MRPHDRITTCRSANDCFAHRLIVVTIAPRATVTACRPNGHGLILETQPARTSDDIVDVRRRFAWHNELTMPCLRPRSRQSREASSARHSQHPRRPLDGAPYKLNATDASPNSAVFRALDAAQPHAARSKSVLSDFGDFTQSAHTLAKQSMEASYA